MLNGMTLLYFPYIFLVSLLRYGAIMKEVVATMTSKGQLTVPAEVRRRLGLKAGDTGIFVLGDGDEVALRVPHYPDVASVLGAAGHLPESRTWEESERVASEERAATWRARLDPTAQP